MEPYCRGESVNAQTFKLFQAFSQIPWDVWQKVVRKEPEWENMEIFLPRYGFGPFAVLMVATALNDYQLKGRAEIAYWPKIRNYLESHLVPGSPEELRKLLWPFYEKERLYSAKIRRLKKFLGSSLSLTLWDSSPSHISKRFLSIWHELASTMNQKPTAKTIVFAMKCLGIALLMAGEYRFDFRPIPIPVDSRVRKFTEELGVSVSRDEEVRNFWGNVLSLLQKHEPRINMIHLDSFVWQIASMSPENRVRYLKQLEIGREKAR